MTKNRFINGIYGGTLGLSLITVTPNRDNFGHVS